MADKTTPALRPSGSSPATVFDRLAGRAARLVSRAPFFVACVLLVVVWLPTTVLVDFDTSQLLINTPTTIVTFLLVALVQNTQTRSEQALQRELNAIVEGLADLMEELSQERPGLGTTSGDWSRPSALRSRGNRSSCQPMSEPEC